MTFKPRSRPSRFSCALLLATTVSLSAGRCALLRAEPKAGKPAPTLVVQQLDGTLFDLKALKGKVIVINFWATWCPPCREEMPALDAFFKVHHGDGLEMLGVSVDRKQDRNNVRKVMRQFDYPAAMACDAGSNGFGSPGGLPLTYVIDGNGAIAAVFKGGKPPITIATLSEAVAHLLPAQG